MHPVGTLATWTAVGMVTLLFSPPAHGQSLRWDHSACTADKPPTDPACTPVLSVRAGGGEVIRLEIEGTCPDAFDFEIAPIPRDEGPAPRGLTDCSETKTTDITHEARWGGYVVYLNRKTDSKANRGNARITISVREKDWALGFSGGFAVTNLVDPVFALAEGTNDDGVTTYTVEAREAAEDDAAVVISSFVHAFRTEWTDWLVTPAATFGIGVSASRGPDYFYGVSFGLGSAMTLTVGRTLREIDRLPGSVQVNDVVESAKALETLGSHRRGGWFLGLSLEFLGQGRSDFEKPFKPGTE